MESKAFSLEQLEKIVKGLNTPFYVRGAALGCIVDDGLYKPFGTFDEYCKARLGFSDVRAKQLINSSLVMIHLKDSATPASLLPASEAETRPLYGLSPDRQRLVWDYVLLHAPMGRITPKYIEGVANQARNTPPGEPLRFLTIDDLPDTKFPSDNDFEIPSLRLDMQATAVNLPLEVWGGYARRAAMPGTYHFYTEDDRFEAVWNDPITLVNSRCTAIIEPNFSIYENTPRIMALHRIYLKRYLAAFWQTQGIRVLVDMNVAAEWARDNLIGVPTGWRAYATRGYTDRLDYTESEFKLACQHAGTDNVLFVVYGGGRRVKEHCQRRGWSWFPEHMDRANKREIANESVRLG